MSSEKAFWGSPICWGSPWGKIVSSGRGHNPHDHGRRRQIWCPKTHARGNPTRRHVGSIRDNPPSKRVCFLWELIGCMALKTLPCSDDDVPPQHRSILRVLHPVTPHKKHIRLLRISYPIDPTRRIRTKGLLWGSRGTFLPTATMVVMVVVAVGLLGFSSHQPLYCRNSTYFPRK